MNKRILITLSLVISISSGRLLNGEGQPPAPAKTTPAPVTAKTTTVKIPVVGDIIELKNNITREINAMTKNINDSIVKNAKAIGSGKTPDEIVKNAVAVMVLTKDKLPAILDYIKNILVHLSKLENVDVIKAAGDVTKIGPKIKAFSKNIIEALQNIIETLKIILQDLQVPAEEIQKLMTEIKTTGLYDMFGKK